MITEPRLLAAAGVGTAFMLAGCTLEPERFVPAPAAALPDAYAQADVPGPYEPLGWWESFEDPVLSQLVSLAVERNYDIEEAVARVEAARAQARSVEAGLWPQITGQAQARATEGGEGSAGGFTRRDPSMPEAERPGGTADGGRGEFGTGEGFEEYGASLLASYEPDIWGRIRSAASAAGLQADAAIGTLQTTILVVAAETMRAYFDLVALEQRLDLVRGRIDILEERSSLTEERFRRGLVESFEVYSIEERLRVLQATEPQLESRLYAAKARLATLTGGYPPALEALLAARDPLVVSLPAAPVPPGLPAALLVQRPDVRAAWLRLEAQRFRVGAERARLFPQISLSGTGGLQAQSVSALSPDDWYASLAAQLTAPLFTGGRIRADIEAQEARMAAEAAAYANVVLEAFQEVETALKDHEKSLVRYRRLEEERRAAAASAEAQLRRVRRGVADYVTYLDAQRNYLGARDDVVQAQRALAEARLDVHRALGGAWTEEDLTEGGRALVAAALGETAPLPVEEAVEDGDADG